MLRLFYFLFFSLYVSASISGQTDSSELINSKNIYEELMVELHLLAGLGNRVVCKGDIRIRKAKQALGLKLKALEFLLVSDEVLGFLSGSTERVPGENAGHRMLRIYRRDAKYPFAKSIPIKTIVPVKDVEFPPRGTGYEDQWSDLMDQNLVKFPGESDQQFGKLVTLREHIISKAVSKVKTLVCEKFVAAGGKIVGERMNLAGWSVESVANIYEISVHTYLNVYHHLDEVKFVKFTSF